MTHAAVVTTRIIADAGLAVTPEQRRLMEQRVTIELIGARREGAQSQRNHDAAVAGGKALLYATDMKNQYRYRAYKEVESAIRDGELPL